MPLRKQKDSQFGQEERRIFLLGKIRLAQQFRGKLRKIVIKLFGLSNGHMMLKKKVVHENRFRCPKKKLESFL